MRNMKTCGPDMAMQSSGGRGGARPPEWVHLIPAGKFRGRDGRGPWELRDAAAFIKATVARQAGADIPLDYEHQSVMAEDNGQPAPAAGWIKELQSRPDGVWGRVEWTERGAALVAAREYRYISPVFLYSKDGGVLERLDSAALVAQPNLQLKALNKQGASTMDEFLKQLAALLGLAETASQEEIFSAVQALRDGGEGAPSANSDGPAEGEPGLGEAEAALKDAVDDLIGAAQDEAEAAANSGKPSAKFVKEATALQARLLAANKAISEFGGRVAALEAEAARNRAEKAVNAAMSAGKITPAMKVWAINTAAADPEGFAKYLETAPVIVTNGPAAAGVKGPGASALGAEERAVCKQLGLSEADYLKSRKDLEVSHGRVN